MVEGEGIRGRLIEVNSRMIVVVCPITLRLYSPPRRLVAVKGGPPLLVHQGSREVDGKLQDAHSAVPWVEPHGVRKLSQAVLRVLEQAAVRPIEHHRQAKLGG